MKKLATNKIPIKIPGKFSTFVSNYKAAKLNKDSAAISYMVQQLIPQFKIWEELFNTQEFDKDIVLYTLFHLIKIDNKPKDTFENKLKNINNHFTYYDVSFADFCIEAFLLHIKKQTKVYKNYNNELKFFFYISREIKFSLFVLLRKVLQKTKQDFFTNRTQLIRYEKFSIDLYIDVLHLQHIRENNLLLYSAYLFFLVNPTLSVYSLKYKYKLSLKQSKTLYEELCQLIKTLPLNS